MKSGKSVIRIVFTILILVGISYGKRVFFPPSVESQLKATVIELQRKLPMKIDDDTSLIRVYSSGKVFTYSYKLTRIADDGKIDFTVLKKAMKKKLSTTSCKAKIKELLEKGVSLKYIYIDKAGKKVMEITIVNTDCKS